MTLFLELLAVAALILLNGYLRGGRVRRSSRRAGRVSASSRSRATGARGRCCGSRPTRRGSSRRCSSASRHLLAIGALGEQALAKVFDPILASVIALALCVPDHHLPARGDRRARAEGRRARATPSGWRSRSRRPVRAFFVVFRPLIWVLQRLDRAACCAPSGSSRRGPRRVLLRGRAEDARLDRSTRTARSSSGEQEMLYKVFDFADKEVADVMVPRPEVVALSIELPPEEALAAMIDSPYTRYPVYRGSLDEIVGDPARARPVLGADRPRDRRRPGRGARPAGAHRPRDEGPGRAARRVPPHEPAHGDRRRRVRRASRGSSRSRTCSRRSSARSRTSSTCRTSRSSGCRTATDPDRRHVPDRRLQRAVRPAAADRGLPHGRAASSSACSAGRPSRATRSRTTARASPCWRSRARGSSESRSSSCLTTRKASS